MAVRKFNSPNGKHREKETEFKKKKEKQADTYVCSPQPVSGKEKRQQQLGLDGTEDPMLPWEGIQNGCS